jgi:hypothetical protein
MELWQTLVQLGNVLTQLFVQLLALGAHWILLIIWVVWWLLGVNWQRAWPALRHGGWAPVILLVLIVSLVWSRLQPVGCDCLGFTTIPNFWWQLGYMSMLVGIALFCGWLQGVLHWAPAETSLEPPAPTHGSDHRHH